MVPVALDNSAFDLAGFPARMALLLADEKSVSAFARRAGVAEGTVRHYLRGGVKPNQTTLELLAQTAGVNPRWLATGEGPQMAADELPALEAEALKQAVADSEHICQRLGLALEPTVKAELVSRVYAYYLGCERRAETPAPAKIIDFVSAVQQHRAG